MELIAIVAVTVGSVYAMTTHRHSLHHTVMVAVLLSTVTVTITWTMLAITGL